MNRYVYLEPHVHPSWWTLHRDALLRSLESFYLECRSGSSAAFHRDRCRIAAVAQGGVRTNLLEVGHNTGNAGRWVTPMTTTRLLLHVTSAHAVNPRQVRLNAIWDQDRLVRA